MKKIILLIIALMIFVSACEEFEIPILNDNDEIKRYIEDSYIGELLFRNDNLIIPEPYFFSRDPNAFYVDIVDSTKRSTSVYIFTDNISQSGNYSLSFGEPYFVADGAEATVVDDLYMTVLRIDNNDTTRYNRTRRLTRYGYFMKLGDDSQAYSGWLMVGYNGGEPDTSISVLASDNSPFYEKNMMRFPFFVVNLSENTVDSTARFSNQEYYELSGINQIRRITPGEQVKFNRTSNDSLSQTHSLSLRSTSGFDQLSFTSVDSIVTVNTSTAFLEKWDFLYHQTYKTEFVDSAYVFDPMTVEYDEFCLPIRIVTE